MQSSFSNDQQFSSCTPLDCDQLHQSYLVALCSGAATLSLARGLPSQWPVKQSCVESEANESASSLSESSLLSSAVGSPVNAIRAQSSVSMDLQKWMAYFSFSSRTCLQEYLGSFSRKKHVQDSGRKWSGGLYLSRTYEGKTKITISLNAICIAQNSKRSPIHAYRKIKGLSLAMRVLL